VPFLTLFGLYGWDFEGPVPAWWCFFSAASYLIYRMLDEMDGKQARKTGNSSPLGLLFDHGCDSFTTSLVSLMVMKVIQMGNGSLIMFTLLGSTQSFYFSTLEEYYIGGLFLGVGNGATDGSLPIIALFIYCGLYGNDGFKNDLFLGDGMKFRVSHLMGYILIATQIVAVFLK
jgi:ethanolaminephosphotransferase